jgi:hypothetical protein
MVDVKGGGGNIKPQAKYWINSGFVGAILKVPFERISFVHNKLIWMGKFFTEYI